jgi:hypothetical protein
MNPAELPLRDLHLPDPVSWWPLAPGWWLLLALLLFGLVVFLNRWRAAYRQHAARRIALRRLQVVTEDYVRHGNAVAMAQQLSALLRRTMLAYAPRKEVAGLTGEQWLTWLDRDLERSHFVEGDGRLLVEWPYRNPALPREKSAAAALLDAVRLRIETPVGGRA